MNDWISEWAQAPYVIAEALCHCLAKLTILGQPASSGQTYLSPFLFLNGETNTFLPLLKGKWISKHSRVHLYKDSEWWLILSFL